LSDLFTDKLVVRQIKRIQAAKKRENALDEDEDNTVMLDRSDDSFDDIDDDENDGHAVNSGRGKLQKREPRSSLM
jgi:hypothetical protein